jgi:hypothetical protein
MICCSKDAPLVIKTGGSDGNIGCRIGRPLTHFQYCSVHEHYARFRLPPECEMMIQMEELDQTKEAGGRSEPGSP